MADFVFEAFRRVNRETLHRIWQKARKGKLGGLTEEEQRLGKVMLQHADEYFNQFEFADALADREFVPETEVNPFLHVTLHAVIEKQLEDRDPIEAFQFYNAMIKNKCTRHEAIHLLMTILLKFLFPMLKKQGGIQLNAYRELLKKYKSRKPDKIIGLLEDEPDRVTKENPKSAEIMNEMHSAFKDQNIKSIDEAQAFADAWFEKKNATPSPGFLGLSPEQMHRVLYSPFQATSDLVTLNKNLSMEEFAAVPVVVETIYFLRRLGEMEPLKATVKGNLPRTFAQEMHDAFSDFPDRRFRIMSEEDDWKLSALRHILDMGGWLKKRRQTFFLTRRGQNVVKNGLSSDDFFHLLDTYMRKFNWASRDLYPTLEIIQQGVLFSLFLLHRKADTYVRADELSKVFIQAFPVVLNGVKGYPSVESEKLVQSAYCVRFLERFCEYFGLVTIKKKGGFSADIDYTVQTTSLFKSIFQWK
jgi:hypothetical protein